MEEVVDSDYVYVMDKGNVVLKGTPKEVFKQADVLKEHRLDVPQVTELAYELRQAGVPLPESILTREELREAMRELWANAKERLLQEEEPCHWFSTMYRINTVQELHMSLRLSMM